MTRNITKSAAAERIHKLAAVARVVQRTKSAGCCGRKPSSKRKRRSFKRSSLNKEASRDFIRKVACAVSVIQRTRGLQKAAAGSWLTNPIAIGAGGGGILGGTLGLALGPKGQKFLSGLAGMGLGAGVGAGAGYGYTKLSPAKEKAPEVTIETPKETKQQEQKAKPAQKEKPAQKDKQAPSNKQAPKEDGSAFIGPRANGNAGTPGSIPIQGYESPNMAGEQARLLASPSIPDSIQLPDEDLDLFNQCNTEQGRIDVITGLYKDMAPQDVIKYAKDPDLFNREKPMLDLGYYTKDSRYAH